MGGELFNLYSDYLLCANGKVTATGLSELFDNSISHDKITRLLAGPAMEEKTLWKVEKKLIREFENEEACLSIDDTIIPKEYMDENEIVCWYYDHTKNRNIKGVNLVTLFYHAEKGNERLDVPIGYRIVRKTIEKTDEKTGKKKRESPETKNEMFRAMVTRVIQNHVKFRYILGDSWFSSSENMQFVDKKRKLFIFELKSNRLACIGEEDRKASRFTSIDRMDLGNDVPIQVWLKGLKIPLVICKQVFKNKDGTTGERYLATNNLLMTSEEFSVIYKKRWNVEVYHESLKQNASIGKSPAHTERTQSNHIFASLYAYLKLERMRLNTNMNHFAIKARIYATALKSAWGEYSILRNCTPATAGA
jgi:hypothetical protein